MTERLLHTLEGLLQDLLLQHGEQILKFLSRLGVHEIVFLEPLDRTGRIRRKRVQLVALFAGDLFKELEKVRRQGFALDDEEACMGLRCIAAVVYNDCSEPLAAISVSGMASRLTDDRLPTLGQTVREVAAELTVALGGTMPAAKSA